MDGTVCENASTRPPREATNSTPTPSAIRACHRDRLLTTPSAPNSGENNGAYTASHDAACTSPIASPSPTSACRTSACRTSLMGTKVNPTPDNPAEVVHRP
ncbi:hypothetical protein Aglo01_65020 [Actinokineospora globicatena]|nr:hypothetical protein Aglo01_65020 [Actinokineospora globicatena]GLW88815.1 hypothetical protein Aglo02_64540 [Actinokineospora globicatena]